MNIENIPSVHPLLLLKDSDATQAQKNKANFCTKNQEYDSIINLNDVFDYVKNKDDQDVNLNKIKRLKEAIYSGTLKIDSTKIAEAIISQCLV